MLTNEALLLDEALLLTIGRLPAYLQWSFLRTVAIGASLLAIEISWLQWGHASDNRSQRNDNKSSRQ